MHFGCVFFPKASTLCGGGVPFQTLFAGSHIVRTAFPHKCVGPFRYFQGNSYGCWLTLDPPLCRIGIGCSSLLGLRCLSFGMIIRAAANAILFQQFSAGHEMTIILSRVVVSAVVVYLLVSHISLRYWTIHKSREIKSIRLIVSLFKRRTKSISIYCCNWLSYNLLH